MNKMIIGCFLVIILSGCASSTKYGNCVGIAEEKDPKLIYKVSANNLFWGIVGFEMIVPPVIVLANEFYCPVGIRK